MPTNQGRVREGVEAIGPLEREDRGRSAAVMAPATFGGVVVKEEEARVDGDTICKPIIVKVVVVV